ERLVVGDGVLAERPLEPRLSLAHLAVPHHLALEELAVLVDQRDLGDRQAQPPPPQPREPLERLLGRRGQEPGALQGREPGWIAQHALHPLVVSLEGHASRTVEAVLPIGDVPGARARSRARPPGCAGAGITTRRRSRTCWP